MLTRLLTLLLFFTPPAHAQAVLQAYSMLYPPLHMGTGSGQKPGIADELVQRAANQAGMTVEISTVPWRRAQLMASQHRTACIFPLTRLPAREKQYQWVGLILPGQVRLYAWPAPKLPRMRVLPYWLARRQKSACNKNGCLTARPM